MAEATVPIGGDVEIPAVGFGVFQVPPDATEKAVLDAIAAGYRHIDTAAIYGNEEAVGAALAKSPVPRSELFITTKLWNTDQGRENVSAAVDASLQRLGLDYVDLYLIHWPCPGKDLYDETWAAMLAVREDGRARQVGVSNFTVAHLDRVAASSGEMPAVNQIELHPYLVQADEVQAMQDRGVVVTAWSPLAKSEVLGDPVLVEIAGRHGVSSAQVALRWNVQRGVVVIPKSVTPERMVLNRTLDFELSPEEMAAVSSLDREYRTGPNPDEFNADE